MNSDAYPPNPAGWWQMTITADADASTPAAGPPQRTTEGLLVLLPDHTLLFLTPGPGAGTWHSDDHHWIALDFTELINYQADGAFTGYASIIHRGTINSSAAALTTAGQGALVDADGHPITTTRTTTRAVRVH